MNKFSKAGFIAAAVAVLLPQAALAKHPTASPLWNGTWQLNVATSKLGSAAGKRSETRVYSVDGNKLTLTATGTDASGKPTQYNYTGTFDGKPHPMVGNPVGDNIAVTLVNPRRIDATVRKGKTMTATGRSVISPDGKHMTLTRKTLRAKSRPMIDVMAFDKK